MSSRADLLERYRALPVPDTTMEAWRFTDLACFDPDAFSAPNGHGPVSETGSEQVSEAKPAPEQTMLDIDATAVATVGEDGVVIGDVPEGVTFEPLTDEADRLGSLVGPEDKFTAHNAAVWKHGLLVRVAKDVQLEKPLYVRIASTSDGGSVFWRLLVVAEEGSRFSLIEEYVSGADDLAAYSNAVAELFVEQGAKLEYVSLQNYSPGTWHFATHHARVERDAELDWVAGGFGSRRGKVRIQNDLAGPGATSRVTGAYFADGTQHLDYDTFQEHIAPNTTSDFAFKGALRDQASVVWRGMIRVEKDAQKTNAYQENRNLLLSEEAHADSIPGLEILANDVRCTHGATLSQVDRDQLFYAMARGLTRQDAERLIVRGFFQDVLDRIELPPVREALAEALEARIPQ
ncbi:MAG TPA: Fe-S cluster assembly protein SufD [Gaiellaceae bacterium]|jgi:Fe-S cluster assembly protein SufD|nr:Fe-S cluster assembly protein SufD [Gaiellaceae bacterium]